MSSLGLNSQVAPLPELFGVTNPPATPQPRLVRAAHEFEAQMMKELMAPLVPGHDPLGGTGSDDSTDSSSALTSFAGEALGKAISEHGGFGIAKSIIHKLSGTPPGGTPVPQDFNQIPTISPFK